MTPAATITPWTRRLHAGATVTPGCGRDGQLVVAGVSAPTIQVTP
jgi:hypothetical protein